MKQKFTSAATSINSTKLPVIYRKATDIIRGKTVIDVGGGRFDNGVEYGKTIGSEVTVFDPYNRSEEHNKTALQKSYDVAFCSNVLNVIDSREAREATLKICRDHAGLTVITVYEGNGTGQGKQTGPDQWQENRKLADYLRECEAVFKTVEIRKGMIFCR